MGRADEHRCRSATATGAGQWLLPAQQARTALNAIRGFTELLLTGGAGPLSAESLDHLRQIAAAGGALEDALRLIELYLPLPSGNSDANGSPAAKLGRPGLEVG